MLNTRLPNILVPKTKKDLDKLYAGYRGDDINYICFSFSRKDLEEIFVTNFFDYLNNILDVEIDEYEEVYITDIETLNILLKSLNELKRHEDFSLGFFPFYIENIINCVMQAKNLNTGIAFFF